MSKNLGVPNFAEVSEVAELSTQIQKLYMRIVLNYRQYGVLYLGSYYNTGPYIHFPHFGNSNLGKLPYRLYVLLANLSQT